MDVKVLNRASLLRLLVNCYITNMGVPLTEENIRANCWDAAEVKERQERIDKNIELARNCEKKMFALNLKFGTHYKVPFYPHRHSQDKPSD